ncbi:MAG: hypothetical protein J6D02_06555 [Lachnospira sp.]|nr:hypothetical protein [Lachnospira sp.]
MKKEIDKGKWMIVLGVLLILIGIGFHMQSGEDWHNREDAKQYGSTTQQEEQASARTESSQENTTEQKMEQSTKQDISNRDESKDKTKEVPTDKWPYGNEEYVDYDEPMRVREFHNNKEYYDAVVEQFAPYEGKDIAFYTTKMLPIELNDPNTEDGTVKVVSYDADTFKELMKYTRVDGIYAARDRIDFHFETTDDEAIYYFYDENISEENSEYINHYFMVNIAPHWWWVRFGAGT